MSIINTVGVNFSPGLQHNSIMKPKNTATLSDTLVKKKPFSQVFLRITFQVAKLVASEFFEQGDIERDKLKSEPMVRFLI